MSVIDYDSTDLPLRYDRARGLRPAVLTQWLDCVQHGVAGARIGTIVDLGCGTGRFTPGLRDRFAGKVIGIDPSRRMLARATRLSGIHYVQARAEAIPLSDRCADMVFMSMVWHHIPRPAAAGAEIARVLRADGFLCVRTSTIDALNSCLYLRFFPAAREINERTLPSRAGLVRWASGCDLTLAGRTTVTQRVDDRLAEYAARIACRGLSDLEAIGDSDFLDGLDRLRRYCQEDDRGQPVVEEIDLFLFRRQMPSTR
jgi:SAM-dependent methyltransferase